MPVNIVEEEKKGTKSDFGIFLCGRLGERGECFSGGAGEFTITNPFGIACDLGHVAGTLTSQVEPRQSDLERLQISYVDDLTEKHSTTSLAPSHCCLHSVTFI